MIIAVLKEREENIWNNSGEKDLSIYGKDEAGSASGVGAGGWYPGPRKVLSGWISVEARYCASCQNI